MSGRIRIGIVGCGHLLQKGLLAHLLCEDFQTLAEVAALCDAAPDRARTLAERNGVPAHYDDFAAMLQEAGIDAAFILTPVQTHHPLALEALRAGKHVYVQKTMATSYNDAREMIREAETRGLTLAAAPGQMLSPAYERMRRILRDGGIGRIAWALAGTTTDNSMETLRPDGIDVSWQFRRGGGALWNTTVYSLHTLTGILGPTKSVRSAMRTLLPQRLRGGVPFEVSETDNALLTLEFDEGVLAFAWGCRSWTGRLLDWGAVAFYGSDGSLEATAIHGESGWPSELLWRRPGGSETFRYPKGGFAAGDDGDAPLAPPPHADLLEQHVYLDALDFVNAIRENRAPAASARHAAHVVEIIEKAYRASETGCAQEIVSTF